MIRPPLPQPVIEAMSDGSPPVGHDLEEVIVSMAQELLQLRSYRDTAMEAGEMLSQRIAELELDNGALTALHADLGAQLTAAWQATGVASTVRGLTTLADVVGVHRAEMDTLRARIAVLEACIAAARAALTPDLVAAIKAAGVEVE